MVDSRVSEYAVIGCVLIDDRCLPMAREVLPSAEPFANERCARAYAAMCTLADSHKPVDPVTVGNAAGVENQFIVECMDIAPACSAVKEYAQGVLEGCRRRQLREIGERIASHALDLGWDSASLLEDARSALEGVAKEVAADAVEAPGDSLRRFLQFRTEVSEGKRQAVKVGFPSLDSLIGGFARGGLYILAARPGVGKSALGIAMADMLAKEHRVLYVSLEMTSEELNARRVAAVSTAPCSYGKLLFGQTTEQEDAAIVSACADLSERKLYLSAVSHLTVAELGVQARNARAEVVMVDYLGLLSGTDRRAGEYERITQISGDLKRLAKSLDCVIVALCQLNREAVGLPGEGEKIPRLSQLRSSGAIEQDADGVLLLHRPEYGRQNITRSPAAPQQFFVDVAKNRHGRTGTVELAWYAPVNRFEDSGGKWPVKSWV